MEIAVVGIGCRFPGGITDAPSLWQFLLDRQCAIGEIPGDRWNAEAFYSSHADATGWSRSKWGGFLDRVFDFDHEFFDISPAEARHLDPQQRLLLQIAYEAIQDSGHTLAGMSAATTGVFVGISNSDFANVLRYRERNDDLWGGSGCAFSIAANRISHRLNLTGPSFSVDTACSSALMAIDQACRNIQMGMCDRAIAGGVNCLFEPSQFISFSNASMLSRTGRISTFDEAANGYVRSEGCGLIVLRPLEHAVRDGDRIYAVVSATATNQDGWTSTLMAPNMRSQEVMLRSLVERAGMRPGDIDYVECHGTGTPTGDPIEAHAVGHAFGRVERAEPVTVGSMKPNLGHMEPAAGAAGFIKSVMTAYNATVAPNIHFENPNPTIPFDALNIRVTTEPVEIKSNGRPRHVVVNSFGWGGANASALISSYEPKPVRKRKAAKADANGHDAQLPVMVPLSAHSPEALVRWAEHLADTIESDSDRYATTTDLAHALAAGRDHFAERAVVLTSDKTSDLVKALRDAAEQIDSDETASGSGGLIRAHASKNHKIVFCFSGQGAQWWSMGRKLLATSKVFADAIDAFDSHFERHSGWKVRDELEVSEKKNRLAEGEVTQPTLIALQIALAKCWREIGVEPDAVLGHSLGEVSAAHVAGILSLPEVARVMHVRSRIQHQAPERGAMAVVGMSGDQIRPFLEPHPSVVISAFNNSTTVTISGRAEPLDQILADLEAHDPNLFMRRLRTDFAWHSELLDYGQDWFRSELGAVKWSRPKVPFVSTVSGRPHETFDLDYWWANLREPVAYERAAGWCVGQGFDMFVEIGPDRTVSPLNIAIAQDAGVKIVNAHSLERKRDDREVFATAAARLYANGVTLDWNSVLGRPGRPTVRPPVHPWAYQTTRFLPREAEAALFEDVVHPLLGKRHYGPLVSWHSEIDVKHLPYLKDHRVIGDAVYPAAAFMEMMIAAVLDASDQPGSVELSSVHFREALTLKANTSVAMTTNYDPATGKIEIFARSRENDEDWTLRAEGYGWRRQVALEAFDVAPAPTSSDEKVIERQDFYTLADRHGLNYGPAFQGVQRVRVIDSHLSVADINLPEAAADPSANYYLHPSALDSILQSSLAHSDLAAGLWASGRAGAQIAEADSRFTLKLPVSIDRLLWSAGLPESFSVNIDGAMNPAGVYTAFDGNGRPCLRIESLNVRTVQLNHASAGESQPLARYYAEQFLPIDISEIAGDAAASQGDQRWFVVGGRGTTSGRVVKALGEHGIEATACKAGEIADVVGGEGGATVVYAGALGRGGANGAAVVPQAEAIALEFIELARVLGTAGASAQPLRIVVLTNQARMPVKGNEMSPAGLAQRVLMGAMRTVANELAATTVCSIDVDDAALGDARALGRLLVDSGGESEWIVRGANHFVPRLQEMTVDTLHPRSDRISRSGQRRNFSVAVSKPGSFDNISLREEAYPPCGDNEVVVETAAVGLNFRDVMAASGVLPGEPEDETAWWRNLGGEASGTIVAVGANVTSVKPGQRVIAVGKNAMRQFANVHEAQVVPIPDDLDLNDAAAVPIAYLTAVYCLDHIARLSKGERVLIHLGTGGVGLAAIAVAKHIGAEIFATAGNDRKRQYLRDLGIEHVMDSRDLQFGDEILSKTGGRGVDVILNSLTGAAIDVGLSCLAPFGRFVEIGKRDVEDDKPLGLRTLVENKSYSVVDLSVLHLAQPALARNILTAVFERISSGDYAMLPVTRYPAAETPAAMRLMSRAEHMGKVVLEFDAENVSIHQNVTADPRFRADRGYVVTGGTNGFGLVLADWLSQYGAGCVFLASRSGTIAPEDQHMVEAMRARGTRVEPLSLDVTNQNAVAAFLKREQAGAHPLAGIFHAAAVLDDGLVSQLDEERVLKVMRPKVAGAWNLHNASIEAGCEIDHFVSFSSIAEVLGSAGQANYAAANAFLGGLSEYRASLGLSANTICLGALSDTGMVARSGALAGYLDSLGIKPMSNADVIDAFSRIVRIADPVLTYATVDWQALGRATPNTATAPRIGALVAASSAKHSLLRSELASTTRDRWEELIAKSVHEEITKVLKIEGRELPFDQPFAEIGIDSLSAFELKNRIESMADVSLPASRFLQAPTINSVSLVIAEAIEESEKASAEEQTAADGGGDADRSDERKAAVLLAAQRRWLALADAGDNDLDALPGPVHSLQAALPKGTDEAALEAAIGRVAQTRAVLNMRIDNAGTQTFKAGAPISLERPTPGGGASLVFTRTGPLWRFAAVRDGEGKLALAISAHGLAADAASLDLMAREIVAELRGKRAARRGAQDWPAILAERGVASGSPEQYRGLSYWREMLARVERPRLPKSTMLGYLPKLADRRSRRIGIYTTEAVLGGAVKASGAEETALIAAFADALSGVTGAGNFVIERWTTGRETAASATTVGPLARTVPVVIDQARGASGGAEAAIARAIAEAATMPGFDTATVEEELAEILPDAPSVLRQFGVAYIDGADEERGRSLRDAARMQMHNDICLNAVRGPDGISFDILFDAERIAEADVRAICNAFAVAYAARSGLTRSRRRKVTEAAWKRARAAELQLSSQIDGLWPAAAPGSAAPNSRSSRSDGTLPLSMQQKFLLDALQEKATTDEFRRFWWISRAFQVRPSIDIARLKEAAATVTSHHEAMRARFVNANGTLRMHVDARNTPPIEVHDLGPVSDAEIVEHIEALDHDVPDPLHDPLWSFRVLRCGKRGDVLYVRVHHTIMDGWSMSQAVEEVLRTYLGQSLAAPGYSFSEYLKDFDRSDDAAELARREDYFRKLLANAPAVPDFGLDTRGAKPNLELIRAGQAHELVFTLANSQKEEIVERAKLSGVSPTALLVGSMAQSIAKLSKSSDDVTMCVPVAMRQDRRLMSLIGWIATVTPVRCEVSAHRSLDRLAQQIYGQYQESMLHLPADFTIRRGALHRELGEAGSYMTLFEAGMLTADGTSGGSSIRSLTQLAANETIKLAGYEIRPIGSDRVRAGCAYHVDIRSFEGPAGHSYRCCYDSNVVSSANAMNLFCEVLTRLGVGDASLSNIRSTGGLVMDPAAE